MKKLSLVLALILALSCFAFVACGEETEENSVAESVATSEAVSEEESVEVSTEASEEASEEVSEEASEEASEEVSEEVSTEASEEVSEEVSEDEGEDQPSTGEITGTNVAKGVKPEVSGTGIGHGPYTADLTDGNAAAQMTYDNSWFAFYNNADADQATVNAPGFVGTLIFNLSDKKELTGVKANLVNNTGSAVVPPKSIKVYVSEDGKSWDRVGKLATQSVEDTAYWTELAFSASAQYVKIDIELDGIFAFINEVEIYAK